MEITAAAAWINNTFAAFDQSVSVAVHQLYNLGGGFFTPFFQFISLLGKGGIVLILLSLVLALTRSSRRVGTAMLIGIALGFIAANLIIKILVARPRPYLDETSVFHQMWLLVGQCMESDKSFPSGHVNATVAVMTPLIILEKPWVKVSAFIFALLMCLARIYLCVHFPSDVLGGIITGFVFGVLGVIITAKLPQKYYDYEFKKQAA